MDTDGHCFLALNFN